MEAIKKLESLFEDFKDWGNNLPVVLYPAFRGDFAAHGEYYNPMLQPHPSAFEDKSTADNIVEFVERVAYCGVWLDLYHMRDIKAVQFQIGRPGVIYADPEIPSQQELEDIFAQNPAMNTEIVQMLRTLKDSGFTGPIIVEVAAAALVKLFGLKSLRLEHLADYHRQIIEYVKSI